MGVVDCVFCKIASKQVPVQPLYEDDQFLAIPDANPQAPVHVLIITKTHYPTLTDVQDPVVIGGAVRAAVETAQRLNLSGSGFRIVVNCGDDGGQTIYHLHIHVLGGRFMSWPPG